MSRSQQNVALLLASLLCFTPVFVWVRIGSPSVSGLSAAARARCGLCDAAELRRGRERRRLAAAAAVPGPLVPGGAGETVAFRRSQVLQLMAHLLMIIISK